jgi:hypothetical protein
MCGIQLAIQKGINAFGFLHRLGTRLEKILFVTERGEELSRSDRIGRVSEPCVNGVSRAASGTLNEHAQDRHDDDERHGTDRPTITS